MFSSSVVVCCCRGCVYRALYLVMSVQQCSDFVIGKRPFKALLCGPVGERHLLPRTVVLLDVTHHSFFCPPLRLFAR